MQGSSPFGVGHPFAGQPRELYSMDVHRNYAYLREGAGLLVKVRTCPIDGGDPDELPIDRFTRQQILSATRPYLPTLVDVAVLTRDEAILFFSENEEATGLSVAELTMYADRLGGRLPWHGGQVMIETTLLPANTAKQMIIESQMAPKEFAEGRRLGHFLPNPNHPSNVRAGPRAPTLSSRTSQENAAQLQGAMNTPTTRPSAMNLPQEVIRRLAEERLAQLNGLCAATAPADRITLKTDTPVTTDAPAIPDVVTPELNRLNLGLAPAQAARPPSVVSYHSCASRTEDGPRSRSREEARGAPKASNKVELREFTGTGDPSFRSWRYDVMTYMKVYEHNSLIPHVMRSLRGTAGELARSLGTGKTLVELLALLERSFGSIENADRLRERLYTCRQKENEGVISFVSRLQTLVDEVEERMDREMPKAERQQLLLDRTFYGLSPYYRNLVQYTRDPVTGGHDFEQLVQVVRNLESERPPPKAAATASGFKPKYSGSFTKQTYAQTRKAQVDSGAETEAEPATPAPEAEEEAVPEEAEETSELDSKDDAIRYMIQAATLLGDARVKATEEKTRACWNCGEEGHFRAECPYARKSDLTKGAVSRGTGASTRQAPKKK